MIVALNKILSNQCKSCSPSSYWDDKEIYNLHITRGEKRSVPTSGCWESRILQVAKAHMLYHGNDYIIQEWLVAVTVPPPWQTHHLCELAAWQSSVTHPRFSKEAALWRTKNKTLYRTSTLQATSGAVFQELYSSTPYKATLFYWYSSCQRLSWDLNKNNRCKQILQPLCSFQMPIFSVPLTDKMLELYSVLYYPNSTSSLLVMSSLIEFLQSHSRQIVGYQLPKPLKLLFRTATVSALVFSSQLVENAKCYRVKMIICFKIICVLTTLR